MLMFKGASYFSLALGPSKLRTGPVYAKLLANVCMCGYCTLLDHKFNP